MAITHPTGWPIAANGDDLSTTGLITSYTMPHAYGAVGDFTYFFYLIGSNECYVTSVTGTKSSSWVYGSTSVDGTNDYVLGWTWGIVSSTSGADALTIGYGNLTGATVCNIWPDSLSSGYGSSAIWTPTNFLPTSGSGTPIIYPTATAATTSNPQAYVGFGASGNIAEGGTTAGFSYIDSPSNSGNELTYNLSLTSGGTYAPTSVNSGGFWDAMGIIVEASEYVAPPSYIFPPPMVLMQAPQRASFR